MSETIVFSVVGEARQLGYGNRGWMPENSFVKEDDDESEPGDNVSPNYPQSVDSSSLVKKSNGIALLSGHW